MVMWVVTRIEAEPVSMFISEAPVTVFLRDKDSTDTKVEIVQATYDNGAIVTSTVLQALQDDGYEPNDFNLPP